MITWTDREIDSWRDLCEELECDLPLWIRHPDGTGEWIPCGVCARCLA